MDMEREFDKRIAAIHGLDRTAHVAGNIEESAMHTRHEEFQAMTSVFLGDDFDRGKLWLVESLQRALHERQTELYRLFESHELAPDEYVESLNTLLADTFAACEVILGTENFVKLFGAPRSELAGFVDRDTFLQANQPHEINSLTAEETDTSDTAQSDVTNILEALSHLSETEQHIIRLLYFEKLSSDEIAQALDLKVSNVIKIRQRVT